MRLPPCQVYVLAVGTRSVDIGVAIAKSVERFIEFRYFRRAYESKVQWPEKDNRPSAAKLFGADRGELFPFFDRDDCRQREIRKLLSNSQDSIHIFDLLLMI